MFFIVLSSLLFLFSFSSLSLLSLYLCMYIITLILTSNPNSNQQVALSEDPEQLFVRVGASIGRLEEEAERLGIADL